MIKVSNLSFSYNGKPILQSLNLTVALGEIVAIIGVSGSGKTTLLKLLTGLYTPQAGKIQITDQESCNRLQYIAYMMQEDLLLPWRTVIDNVTLAAELGHPGRSKSDLRSEAAKLLKEVGLGGYEQMFPEQLSGGMRQRVSLARALLQKRPILFLDEPFGSLDVSIREQLYELLQQVQEKYHLTVLIVTHDFRDALSLADRILLLANGTFVQEWSINHGLRYDPIAGAALLEQLRAGIRKSHVEVMSA